MAPPGTVFSAPANKWLQWPRQVPPIRPKLRLFITAILLTWSAYALSGAGVLPRLPLLRPVLCAITGLYLLRGFAFYPMMVSFPGNSLPFWLWSSAICAVFGLVHLRGLRQAWSTL